MGVPSYSDLGKAAKDLLGKDYPTGSTKLELNTTTASGIKVTVTGDKDNKSGAIASDLKFKFSDKAKGLTFTQTVKTSNVITALLEADGLIAPGLKTDLEGSLTDVGLKTVKAGAEFKKNYVFVKSSLDLYNGPLINADAVAGKNGILFGADVSYDVSQAKLSKWGYAAGYVAADYQVTLKGLSKCSVVEASYYQKVNKATEISAKASGALKALNNVTIEVGTKYALDSDAFVKVKTDSLGRLGLGYTQVLRPGIKLSLGGLFDTTRLQENAHKIGLSLSLEA